MLGLLEPTDPAWVKAAETQFQTLLSDHAHCELKAAHNALSLIGRYGCEAPTIVEPLSTLAYEEIAHFRQVKNYIDSAGGTMSLPNSDGYVVGLRHAAKEHRRDTPLLLDKLLLAALIEARSCERFMLLAENLSNTEFRSFYRELMESEAGHFRLFTRLAEQLFGAQESRLRLSELARHESAVAHNLPLGPQVHG